MYAGTAQPARRIGRPPASDSRITHANLIVAARKQFALVGYTKATNAFIAQECLVTAGTVHHHFGGKERLYAEVAADAATLVLGQVSAAADPTIGFVANLKRAIAATAASNARHPYLAHFAVSVSDEAVRHPELKDVARAFHKTLDSFYDPLISNAIRSKEICTDTDAQALKDVILVLRTAAARLAIQAGAGTPRHRRAMLALDALIDGNLFTPDRRL